ncbi:hypothetical protein [Deinococcus misasensis]|uniref:hypothetical protein n=1 Tax=Deinococcus misasensis TaxID=392413 RepID=UPI0005518C50|nr:hypothetical protein [Deinococcus misasensis]
MVRSRITQCLSHPARVAPFQAKLGIFFGAHVTPSAPLFPTSFQDDHVLVVSDQDTIETLHLGKILGVFQVPGKPECCRVQVMAPEGMQLWTIQEGVTPFLLRCEKLHQGLLNHQPWRIDRHFAPELPQHLRP